MSSDLCGHDVHTHEYEHGHGVRTHVNMKSGRMMSGLMMNMNMIVAVSGTMLLWKWASLDPQELELERVPFCRID